MAKKVQKELYLLLDSRGEVLARGWLENSPDADRLQVRILDGEIDLVLKHEAIQMIGIASDVAPMQARIVQRRSDVLILQKTAELEEDVRQNLRVPTCFESFIYPLTSTWTGRRRVKSNDLSCGGIAFFCEEPLERGEKIEIVVPITAEPMILPCEVLRERPSNRVANIMYAAKFINLCNDEDMLVREAVFGVQLQKPEGTIRRYHLGG